MKNQTRYIFGIIALIVGGAILTSMIFPAWLWKIFIATVLIILGIFCFK